MELIERYIYAVVRHLPPRQRADIEKELRSLIEDMLQQRTAGQPPKTEDIEAVLIELGDPGKMADNYRGSARFLIGPAFFEIYWLVLRIVLIAVGFALLLASAIQLAVNPPGQPLQAVGELFSGLINGLFSAFAIVTLIFALNEYFNPQAREKLQEMKDKWQPSQLPAIPSGSLRIKRSEPIVGIIFMLVFLCVININLDLIGVYISDSNGLKIIPLFSELFRGFLPWINVSIILSIIIESVKLITGRWTLPLVAGSLVQKTFSLVIGLWIFSDSRIFSSSFFSEIQDMFQKTGSQLPVDLAAKICKIIIIVIVIGFVIDVLTTGWKAIRIMLDRRR